MAMWCFTQLYCKPFVVGLCQPVAAAATCRAMLDRAPVGAQTQCPDPYYGSAAALTLMQSSSTSSVQQNCCSCTTVRGLDLSGAVGCRNSMPNTEMAPHMNCMGRQQQQGPREGVSKSDDLRQERGVSQVFTLTTASAVH
jgi:hypothetical protein